jgi:hypothetical protein
MCCHNKIPIIIQSAPLATETGISLIILPLMRILQRNLTHTTDTFLFISHTTKVLLFKFRCNIFIGVRIIKEMPGSVASGTLCIIFLCFWLYKPLDLLRELKQNGMSSIKKITEFRCLTHNAINSPTPILKPKVTVILR